jgi:hypothetical protein
VTQEEVFKNAWECATVALWNLSYESADQGSLSTAEMRELTDRLRDIANWFHSQKEKCWEEWGSKQD